jgi:hypothetical protein
MTASRITELDLDKALAEFQRVAGYSGTLYREAVKAVLAALSDPAAPEGAKPLGWYFWDADDPKGWENGFLTHTEIDCSKPDAQGHFWKQKALYTSPPPAALGVEEVARVIDPEGFRLLAEGKNLTAGQAVMYRDAFGKAHLILALLPQPEPEGTKSVRAMGTIGEEGAERMIYAEVRRLPAAPPAPTDALKAEQELSSDELKLVDKHCDWAAFKCAFNAVMKHRAAIRAKDEGLTIKEPPPDVGAEEFLTPAERAARTARAPVK